jgi:hypothetical protein
MAVIGTKNKKYKMPYASVYPPIYVSGILPGIFICDERKIK